MNFVKYVRIAFFTEQLWATISESYKWMGSDHVILPTFIVFIGLL